MFSIVIPLYNKGPYVLRCLNSVLSQSYQGYEIILVNDGSTDNSVELVAEHFPSITIIHQENQGVSAARNAGMILAKNEYIAFLDADDAWHSDYLLSVSKIIMENKDVKIIGAHYSADKSILDEHLSCLEYNKIEDYFLVAMKNTLFSSSATVVRKSVIVNSKMKFNSSLWIGEDLDFWFRINMLSGQAFYIRNTLVFYSNEDPNKSQYILPDLNYTLVGTITEAYIGYAIENKYMISFVSHYVLFNLYPYFYDKKYHDSAVAIYKSIVNKNLLFRIAYGLPFFIGNRIIKNKKACRVYRLYLKAILKIGA